MDTKPKPRTDASLSGLRKVYAQKQEHTLGIVSEAITRLKRRGSRITLGRIADETRELTGTGRGISESTILRNAACRELYEQEANPARKRRSTKRVLTGKLKDTLSDYEARRMHYLMRLTKAELVAMIMITERSLKAVNGENDVLREQILLSAL